MFERLDKDVRHAVLVAAMAEAQRRGDRRLGTDHLLLGLLSGAEPVAVSVLGVDLATARAASAELDRAALAAIGVDLGGRDLASPARGRRRPPFSSGARETLKMSVEAAQHDKGRYIEARHLLSAVLARQRPDPAAELLRALGVDTAAARDRLAQSSN